MFRLFYPCLWELRFGLFPVIMNLFVSLLPLSPFQLSRVVWLTDCWLSADTVCFFSYIELRWSFCYLCLAIAIKLKKIECFFFNFCFALPISNVLASPTDPLKRPQFVSLSTTNHGTYSLEHLSMGLVQRFLPGVPAYILSYLLNIYIHTCICIYTYIHINACLSGKSIAVVNMRKICMTLK